MEINEYETMSLEKIKEWEKKKHHGFHKKVLDVTSKPVDYLIGKIGDKKLKKFEETIEKTVKNLLYASTSTVNPVPKLLLG